MFKLKYSIFYIFLGSLLPLLLNAFEYAIVLDCGSKGTRMHIYRRKDTLEGSEIIDILPSPKKIVPGLSKFGTTPLEATDYLFPLLVHAAQIIPSGFSIDTFSSYFVYICFQ